MGVTFLFWGAMTGNFITGILCALLVEGAGFLQFRWDFDEKSVARAWQLTTLAIAFTAIFIWLDGNRYTALSRLVIWLPPLLLPMQFVQSYGLRNSLPVTALSFFSKQRLARNKRLGLEDRAIHFHFGNVYLIVILISSTLGENATMLTFLPGLALLVLRALLPLTGKRRGALVVVILGAVMLAIAGQLSLGSLHSYLSKRGHDGGNFFDDASFDPEYNRTAIGSLGPLKMSPNIVWRLSVPLDAPVPKLLRTASYDTYSRINWKNTPSIESRQAETDFQDLATLESETPGDPFFVLQEPADPKAIRNELPRYQLRGAVKENTPLPLPGDAVSLRGFEVVGIESNTKGTVRVFPKQPVIDGVVLWRGESQPDSPPGEDDLKISSDEKEIIQRIATELGLQKMTPVGAKVAAIQSWMRENFTYTRYLSIPRKSVATKSPTEIGRFLTTSKKGHCEYFATAASLLLREAGVPTRYAIGYSVMEKDAKRAEYLLRGIHGHAWCRVWDESTRKWGDFDPTPPGWLPVDSPQVSSTQWLTDSFQRMREDFFLWRNQAANRLRAGIVMAVLATAVMGFIGWKLWGSRRSISAGNHRPLKGPWLRTPLHDLEPIARKKLGPRPPGLPFPQWLRGLSAETDETLEEAIQLHQRLRFDPLPSDPSIPDQLSALVNRLKAGWTAQPR